MSTDRQPLDVLEDKIRRSQLSNYSQKMPDKTIARIVQGPIAYQRKSLAGRPSKNYIDVLTTNFGKATNLLALQVDDGSWNDFAAGEVERVNCAMNRIDLDRRSYIEARLLEAKA